MQNTQYHSSNPSLYNVKDFFVTPMGKLGQQYRRTISTDLGVEKAIVALDKVPEVVKNFQESFNGSDIDESKMTEFFSHLVSINTKAEPVAIYTTNGEEWSGEVSSFVLTLEHNPLPLHGTRFPKRVYYIGGYCLGDPTSLEAEFTINSVHSYVLSGIPNNERDIPPYRNEVSVQLVNNPKHCNPFDSAIQHLLRPSEVFSNIDAKETLRFFAGQQDIVDLRIFLTKHLQLIDYTTNDPLAWGEKLLKSHVKVLTQMQPTAGGIDIMGDYNENVLKSQSVAAPLLGELPFLRILSHMSGKNMDRSFTLNELRIFSKDVIKEPVIKYIEKTTDVSYDSLGGDDITSFTGSYIDNSVPALMAKHSVRSVVFPAGGDKADFPHIEGIHQKLSPAEEMDFLADVRCRVNDLLTKQTQLLVGFSGEFNLFGNSKFSLEIAGQEKRQYCSPTFINASFSPQVTSNTKALDLLTAPLSTVLDACDTIINK